MGLPLVGWLVAWNPSDYPWADAPAGAVKVGPWPDTTGWSHPYCNTDGCCRSEWAKWSWERQLKIIFIIFNTLVVRDGIAPLAAHREFLKIDAYRECISPDMEGAAAA
jgi:hypothetical protein